MKRMLSFLILAGMVLMPVTARAAGFPAEDIQVLDSKQIEALPDDKLVDTYVDMLAEIEASRTFHVTSGFTPKEYKKYKDLVKFRMQLLFEINRRKIDLPPTLN